MWIPLDDHSHEISLGLLRGSHRWGNRYRPERINGGWYEGYSEDDGFVPPPDVANHPEQYDILSWDMHAGDCIVFHGLTLHGSRTDGYGINGTAQYVRYFSIRDFGGAPAPMITLVRLFVGAVISSPTLSTTLL